jgi:Ca2+:H+ antiporter
VGLVLPTVFANALASRTDLGEDFVLGEALKISRAVAIVLLIAFFTYTFFQSKSHDSLFAEIFTADEHKDADRHKDLAKEKLTLTECIIALLFALTCVSLIAVFLVLEIEFMVDERHVADAFVGLILIPLVEKFAGKSSRSRYYTCPSTNETSQNT